MTTGADYGYELGAGTFRTQLFTRWPTRQGLRGYGGTGGLRLHLDFSLILGYNVAQRSKSIMTTQNSVVRARIDGRTKVEAEAVLASIGLTVSDAFRMMMIRIAREKALPFEPLIPNDETIEAMKAARRGEFVWMAPLINCSRSLNADD